MRPPAPAPAGGDRDPGDRQRALALTWPVDLVATLGPLRHGTGDPTMRIEPGPPTARRGPVTGNSVWRTTRTDDGPATVCYQVTDEAVLVRAWGPGADHAVDTADLVLGAKDEESGLPARFPADRHPVMSGAHRRFGAGWRAPRTGRVLESLVPAVLEQRVTGKEATRAWAGLVRQFGTPAPGPAGLLLAPDAATWSRVPSWAWHQAGVDPRRAGIVVAAAARGEALERLTDRPLPEALAALRSLPGIGPWTAAEVAVRAWGDPDSVSFGDYHLAGFVTWALTGQHGGTDESMARLLEPWAGQRARAVRLLELHCPPPPRRGPRAAISDHRRR